MKKKFFVLFLQRIEKIVFLQHQTIKKNKVMKNSRIFADLVYFDNVIKNGLEWAQIEYNEIGSAPIMKKMYRRGYRNITTLKELAAFRRYNNRFYYNVNSKHKGYCFGLRRMEQKDYTDIELLKLNCR